MRSAVLQKAENKSQSMITSSSNRNADALLAENHEMPLEITGGPAFDFGKINVYNTKSAIKVQPKLQINQPGDQYEQEADAMADKVMRMGDPLKQPQSFTPIVSNIQRKCAHCKEEEKKLHRKESGNSLTQNISPAVEQTLKSTGQPVDKSTNSFMKQRFGYDFGNVRIHNDALAHRSSADINAKAYTRGNHVVFGEGQYTPHTNSGKQLIAHELSHVVQQSAADRMLLGQTNEERGPVQNPLLSNVVQRDAGYYAKSESEVVDSVIDALHQPTVAGLNVDPAFDILNQYPMPFQTRVLAELYDQGYFSGLLGYLAGGTKANHQLIVAIRFIQCQKDTSYLFKQDILEAESFLKDDVTLPPELNPMLECLKRERIRLEKEEENKRFTTNFESGSEQSVLKNGVMDWHLYPSTSAGGKAKKQRMQIRFYPRAQYKSKTVTFLQTLLEQGGGDDKTKIDIGVNTDAPYPFYGVGWDTSKGQWVASNEGKDIGFRSQPSSADDPYAYMFDQPVFFPPPHSRVFESVAVVLETGETLGALTWGVGAVPAYAEKPTCTEKPSSKFNGAVATFYTPKNPAPAHGYENYDLIFDGFAPDDARLTTKEKKQLDSIVERTKKMIKDSGDPVATKNKLVIEGFGDSKDSDPMEASEKRATAVETYIVSKGVPKDTLGKLYFGASWARYEVSTKEAQGGHNRRVQIRLF